MYTIYCDGRDYVNRKVSAGVYFVRFSTEEFTDTKKVVFIR